MQRRVAIGCQYGQSRWQGGEEMVQATVAIVPLRRLRGTLEMSGHAPRSEDYAAPRTRNSFPERRPAEAAEPDGHKFQLLSGK